MAPTVLITGGSQGIGKAIALRFAQGGYNIVLAARQADRLALVADEVRSHAPKTLAIPTDVRDPQQVEAMIQQTLAEFGAIDVLVNNAGIYASGPAEQFSIEDWHQILDTNLWGYIHTIHAALPHLLERRQGTIVNLCSIGGRVPLPYLVPYSTSKFAVDGLTQSLRSELAPKGIQVCGIYPNLIKTSFLERAVFRGVDAADQQERRQQVEQVVQAPLVEKPEDVAIAVWEAVTQQQDEVIVGSAKASAGAHHLFPKAVQWIIRKTFQHKDTAA